MTRLLALVQKAYGIAPNQRFRLEQWEPYLRSQHGIVVDYAPFESPRLTRVRNENGHLAEKAGLLLWDTLRRTSVLRRARNYDGVVILREAAALGPAILERLLVRQGIPLVFDFDDAIWLRAPYANGGANARFDALRFPRKTSAICRVASSISVGNEYLAQYARQFNPNVFIVPTSIDLATYPVQPERPLQETVEIVWMGTSSTLVSHLESARPAIERFAERRKVLVRVICDRPPARPFRRTETVFERWRADNEAEAIGRGHIAIMPLPDDEFSRGKCGCKALQYMAAGRPVVLSPVGMNRDIACAGQNALSATTVDEWVDALEKLSSSAELRIRLARAGRQLVEERFSAQAAAARFATAVSAGVGRRVDGAAPSVPSRQRTPAAPTEGEQW